MLIESTPRSVPRIAPRILLTSKESIAGKARAAFPRKQAGCRALRRRTNSRFASVLATRITGRPRTALLPLPSASLRAICERGRAGGAQTPDVLILIPARMVARGLPGKPLLDIAGEPMIAHVMRRAQAARL